MKGSLITAFWCLSFLTMSGALKADNSGRIYGRIYTKDNEEFVGLIRWDKNEVNWVDVLDGNKDLPEKNRRAAKRHGAQDRDREHSIEIFGLKVGGNDENFWWSDNAQSGIRFGHLKSLKVIDDDRVLLALKSGIEVELTEGSTDIGQDIRELIIEDEKKGEIELVWDDIETVEFSPAQAGIKSRYGDRLYGNLTTRRGDEYSGFVCWDVDEVLTDDVIDGEERDRTRKIELGTVSAIERYSSSGATVFLKSGDQVILKGTNDVDDSNRGIIISDPGFGQMRVDWDEFSRLDFTPAKKSVTYDQFDGGRKLNGTVYAESGESYTGEIRWDNDEEYTWEILDGDYRGAEFDVEFGLIKTIEKNSTRTSLVTVWDGRSFRLRGSNDVDEENKGIFITQANGDVEQIGWDEFKKVEFAK